MSFVCEGGDQDKTVIASQRSVAAGLTEETLLIHENNVKIHAVNWNATKNAACTYETEQLWKADKNNYQIIQQTTSEPQQLGDIQCAVFDNSFIKQARPLQLGKNKLRLYLTHSQKKVILAKGAFIPCNGGSWIRIYEKMD